MKNFRLLLKLLGLSCLLILTNTMVKAESEINSSLLSELEKNRQLWRSQEITDYQFIYQQQCFCPPPANTLLKVLIDQNNISQVLNLKTGQPLDNSQFNQVKSIEQLFTILEEAIKQNADEITVTYDSQLGYPTKIAIDYKKIMADEEQGYLIKDLQKL